MLPFLIAAYLNRPELLVCAVVREAERQGLDPIVVCSLVEVESGFNPRAKGSGGDYGLFQIHPRWHGAIYKRVGDNVAKGCQILRTELNRCNGKIDKALGRYNAGSNRRLGAKYASKVLSLAARIKEAVEKKRTVPHHYPFRVARKDRLYPLSWLEWAPRKKYG